MAIIGIIGGSGLDDPDILKDSMDVEAITSYGEASAPLRHGTIDGAGVFLLARHGREHTIPPSQVNYRANIQALADQGCTHIVATTAVGSLRKEIGRGDLAILDQFIDFTRHRQNTFYDQFEPHRPLHVSMANPFSTELRELLIQACGNLEYPFHKQATVVTIEGPRFSTRAESHMFRAWGADVINMSIAPECALANEAGIPYAAVAMSTDYDCWKEDEEPVTWEAVLETFSHNAEKVKTLLLKIIPMIR
ncbi:MAG: S-methyl-5'-thioadenosine phosphorylase [Spirochaetales bacterium]|jgi:5'-methylthioadenosine phosphorylase|nr:S-methyl-5'-thioadenosine phosphorylase [Spirochaetales bacterium]